MNPRTLMMTAAACLTVACGGPDESAAPGQPDAAQAPEQIAAPKTTFELTGERLFTACAGCHTLAEGGAHTVGPNLHGIIGQPAGTRPGYAYSEAMKNSGLQWNAGTLRGFIMATESVVPGTFMAYDNIVQPGELTALIDYIIGESGGGQQP